MPKIRLLVSLITLLSLTSLTVAQNKDKDERWSRKSRGSHTISTNDSGPFDSCVDRVRIYSDDYADTELAEETRTFPNQPLKVIASRNGGIQVQTWDKAEISVKVCKAAAARSSASAKALLDQIKLNASGNTISVSGPEKEESRDRDHTWSTVIVISAPAGATLDLSAHNGGIALKKFSGNATAETVNGGISLNESTGKLHVTARNGGISIKDCGGDVKADVQNGGLSIELAETWSGTGLEANTHNGGVSIAVPKGMQSGVEVAMKGHGSISCRADACDDGQRTWDDNSKMVRFGSGATVIRASTVNGGLVIKERGRKLGKL